MRVQKRSEEACTLIGERYFLMEVKINMWEQVREWLLELTENL